MAGAPPANLTLIDVPYDCGRHSERKGAGSLALAAGLLAATGHARVDDPASLEVLHGFGREPSAAASFDDEKLRTYLGVVVQ